VEDDMKSITPLVAATKLLFAWPSVAQAAEAGDNGVPALTRAAQTAAASGKSPSSRECKKDK
jgi:hypothetical protein